MSKPTRNVTHSLETYKRAGELIPRLDPTD